MSIKRISNQRPVIETRRRLNWPAVLLCIAVGLALAVWWYLSVTTAEAELYMEERKYGGNAMGFLTETYPAIDAVTFEVVLGVGSPEASEAFSKHLSVLYGADRKFQARVHALVMEDVERWNA